MKKKVKLSILIPVKNEGINITIMLKILRSVLEFPHEVIVIYDSPKDDAISTVRKLKKHYPQAKSLHNTIGKGVANAIKAGIRQSVGDYILIFNADEIGPVIAIEDMIYLMGKGCDLVSCTRYAYGGRRLGGSIIEGFLSRVGNKIFKVLIGSTLTDSTTGIKMFKRGIFNKLELESQVGWAVMFEMAIKAQEKGLKLGEVPIISIDRLYGGKSTFKLSLWFKEYFKWFLYGVEHLHFQGITRPVAIRIPKASTA